MFSCEWLISVLRSARWNRILRLYLELQSTRRDVNADLGMWLSGTPQAFMASSTQVHTFVRDLYISNILIWYVKTQAAEELTVYQHKKCCEALNDPGRYPISTSLQGLKPISQLSPTQKRSWFARSTSRSSNVLYRWSQTWFVEKVAESLRSMIGSVKSLDHSLGRCEQLALSGCRIIPCVTMLLQIYRTSFCCDLNHLEDPSVVTLLEGLPI